MDFECVWVMEFNSRGARLNSLDHWANGVKEYSLTGCSFSTRDGFTGQGNQIGNN